MKISTKVILNHEDMVRAAEQYVIDALDLDENAEITALIFNDQGEIFAHVEVSSDDNADVTKPVVDKPARKTRTPRGSKKAAATVNSTADQEQAADQQAAADQAKGDEPWVSDTDQTEVGAEPVSETPAATAAIEVAQVKSDAPKIFNDPVSSAAPSAPKPVAVLSPKSLFANLAAPVNTQAAAN